MSMGIALYYPYIAFRDDRWVKAAALYWDRIGRIVPREYQDLGDSDLVRALRDDMGIIEDMAPSPAILNAIGREFTDVIGANADALLAQFDPERADGSRDPAQLSYLYHTKVDRSLVRTLEEAGLGRFERTGQWLGVHPRLGHAYMTALASRMAGAGGLDVVSDDPSFVVAGCGYPIRQIIGNMLEQPLPQVAAGDAAETMLGVLAIQQALPADLDSITPDSIRAFRDETTSARLRYRELVSATSDDLRSVEDPAALRLHLEARSEQIAAEVDDLGRQMDAYFGSVVLSVIGVSKDIPDSAALAIGAMGLSLQDPMVVAGGLAFNAFQKLRASRAEIRELEDHPHAYLLAAHERWAPKGMVERLRTGARRLLVS